MNEYSVIRLGKDSISDIKKIDSLHSPPKEPISFVISCTQVPLAVKSGWFCFVYLGSDNRKGFPTVWNKGLRAIGKIRNKSGGPDYASKWQIEVEIKIVLPDSITKQDFLAGAPNAYYWFSEMPVIGLTSYSNQTVQHIKSNDVKQNIGALIYALVAVYPTFKEQLTESYPELAEHLNYIPLSSDVEGDDTPSMSSGWKGYPLDSVFVRQEQRTVNEVVNRINTERIILNPDFQRDFVWSIKKQSRLIESCLMRIPLPVFYVAEAKDGRIIVVDGLQRLNTFKNYLDNKFSLAQLGAENENNIGNNNQYNEKRFKELPITLQERIQDTQLTLYILDSKAPDRAKLDIFERVNSGEPLARQQMRNCLFNGPATKWLKTAANSNNFLTATGWSIDSKTMRDREVINRFCAFRLLGVEQYKADMDDFLARALDKMNNLNQEELDELYQIFLHSMDVNYKLFGKHAFRKSLATKSQDTGRTVINVSLFDVCSVLLAKFEYDDIETYFEPITSMICKLLDSFEFVQAITYGTNGVLQVKTRFNMMEDAIEEIL